MKKLTKKQRNESYKKALDLLKSPNDTYWGGWKIEGICHALMHTTFPYTGSYNDYCLLSVFREFSLFHPNYIGGFWFENKIEREIVLEFCIAMTE